MHTARDLSTAATDVGPWFVVKIPADFVSRTTRGRTTTTWLYQSGTYPVRLVPDERDPDHEPVAACELDVILTTRTEITPGWSRRIRTTHPGVPTVVTHVWAGTSLVHGAAAVLADDRRTVAGTFLRVA